MPSKRSHGEGTLRHRSDGRWELRMMDGYQKDGSPRFKTFYGKTQKEVKLKLKEYQDALISGVQLDTIHIRQAVKVVKGTVSIGSPKSKDSIRDIPVPLNVRPCAIKLRDTTDQFIWESPKTGLPCNPTHFRDVFRKSLEEAGDVRLLTPHSCRHTYVSQMQALGVDIQTIQSIVGHADTEMTEHYLHVQESIRQSAIQLFSEAFSA